DIHCLNDKIFKRSKQGGAKIIFLSNINKLTESANNALLKTLEEPPENTWFFLINYNNTKLYQTLISRCIIYNLPIPPEENTISWLK
ncbi:MAG: DNA polymerase III subunit delta', partial [Buchnera aphidicola]|nr:DNA polymerase III subunit delta' [Buchnera aphidicola]